METLAPEEPATAGAETETLPTDSPDGSPDGNTPPAGQPEDADKETLKQRIADKDSHISNLETELRTLKKKPKTAVTTESEEDTLWIVENADALKMCKPEYQAYIAKGYSKPDALRLAKLDKGLIKEGEKPQVATDTPVQGEQRRTKTKPQLTEQQRSLKITQEMLEKYGPEVEPRRK